MITEVKIAAECLENPATLPKKPTSFVVRCLDHFHQQNNATHAFQSKGKFNGIVFWSPGMKHLINIGQ